jgi:5-methylcytosine-specific restriction endonuclease McrA
MIVRPETGKQSELAKPRPQTDPRSISSRGFANRREPTVAWGGNHSVAKRKLVLAEYGRICWLCHQPIDGLPSADHVIPRSRGGSDDIENLRPAHLLCNKRRGNRMPKRSQPLLPATDW